MPENYVVMVAPSDLLFGPRPGSKEPPQLETRVIYSGDNIEVARAAHTRERHRILACLVRDVIYFVAPLTIQRPQVWNWQDATMAQRIHAIGLDNFDTHLPETWVKAAHRRTALDPTGHVVWRYVPGDTRAMAHARAVSPVGLAIVARMSH